MLEVFNSDGKLLYIIYPILSYLLYIIYHKKKQILKPYEERNGETKLEAIWLELYYTF